MTTNRRLYVNKSNVIKRDNRECVKCKTSVDLHVHHIEQVKNGGGNEASNLITLCGMCHREWHYFQSVLSIPFGKWLNVPPYLGMVAFFMMPENQRDGETVRQVYSMIRSLDIFNSDECTP